MDSRSIMRFEDLEAWQRARQVVREIYRVARTTSLSTDYRLRDQFTAAGVSIMSNIAEGFERISVPQKAHLYDVARGSCGESRSLTYVCEDVGHIAPDAAVALRKMLVDTGQLVSGLLRSTERRRR